MAENFSNLKKKKKGEETYPDTENTEGSKQDKPKTNAHQDTS